MADDDLIRGRLRTDQNSRIRMEEARRRAADPNFVLTEFARDEQQLEQQRQKVAEQNKRQFEEAKKLDPTVRESDFSKLLATRLGGKSRPLTLADLQVFERHVKQHAQTYKGGIRLAEVINHSLAEDIQRANEQIKQAHLWRFQGDELNYVTNASANSADKRHFVNIELLDLKALAAQPIGGTPTEKRKQYRELIKAMLDTGKIKFDCDCGRHTFWYRYLASVGGFAHGRLETGYPKIRNPNMQGVACKHVLRVAAHMLSAEGREDLIKVVNARRKHLTQSGKVTTVDRSTLANRIKRQSDKKRVQLIRKSSPSANPAQLNQAQQDFANLVSLLRSQGFSTTDITAAMQRGLMGL